MKTCDLHIYSASLYYFTTKTALVLFKSNYTLLSKSSFIFVSVWSKVALRMRWPPKRCLSLISPTWSLSCTQSFFTSPQTIWKFELLLFAHSFAIFLYLVRKREVCFHFIQEQPTFTSKDGSKSQNGPCEDQGATLKHRSNRSARITDKGIKYFSP